MLNQQEKLATWITKWFLDNYNLYCYTYVNEIIAAIGALSMSIPAPKPEQPMTRRRMQAAAHKLIDSRWSCDAFTAGEDGPIIRWDLATRLGLFHVQVLVRGPGAPSTVQGALAMIAVGKDGDTVIYRQTADDLTGALTGVATQLRQWSNEAVTSLRV